MFCCADQDLIIIEGYQTCVSCGCVNFHCPELVHNPYANYSSYMPFKIEYERINYFLTILNNILGGYVDCAVEHKLKEIKELLPDIDDIYKIKKWMKNNRYNKEIKYIYRLYYLKFDKKAVEMDSEDIEQIYNEFLEFDLRYNLRIQKRNQLNYNFIIYKLCEKLGIDNSKILLPKSKAKLEQIYNSIYI
jgi:hypothetical protein